MATEILPGLWLGDVDDAKDEEFIKIKNIGSIINCTKGIKFTEGIKVTRKRIPLTDNSTTVREKDDTLLLRHLPGITEFIHEQLGSNRSVLVHCYAGRQRSASVVAGYLIRYGGMPLQSVIIQMQSKRPVCFVPYNNFRNALTKFERLYTSRSKKRKVLI